MKRRPVLFVILLLLLAGAVLYLSRLKIPLSQSASETSTADRETITVLEADELTYTIDIPEGWEQTKDKKEQSSRTVRYENKTTGDYFDVISDPIGRDVASDYSWAYEVNENNTVRLVSESSPCDSAEKDYCSSGDNKLTIFIKPKDSSDAKTDIKGSRYIFFAGNSLRETEADLGVYRNILATFKLK